LLTKKLAARRTVARGLSAALVAVVVLGGITLGLAGHAMAGAEVAFPRPPSLEPNIHFWVNVFTAYSSRDFIIFDGGQMWKVYQVLHLPGEGAPTRSEADSVRAYLKAKYSRILTQLAAGNPPANYEEKSVARLFKGDPPSAYALAAQNLRVQEGMRERFRQTLLRSRYYTPAMERIFRGFGLPAQLVTLAAVESGFHTGARSSAGAVGIWQFTRPTGRHYMRITRYHDDRLSPARSTEAAAKLLLYNYSVLHDWPLAITAYNYGTGGMARAEEIYGNNFARVLRDYDGPRFGFATKNYYAEFLAAVQVDRYKDKYFPGIEDEWVPPPPPAVTTIAHRPHRDWRWHHRLRRHIAQRHERRHGRVEQVAYLLSEKHDGRHVSRLHHSRRHHAHVTRARRTRHR
jgi:peptidoglycan lytic transglycosylase D